MINRDSCKITGACSFAHFWVDLCCAAIMLGCAGTVAHKGLVLIVYNFCAFGMQLPMGVAADRLGGGRSFGAIGCAGVGLAGFLGKWPMAAAVIAGLGNAAFHIGGGAEVLKLSRKASMLGTFVSTGAIGLFAGGMLADYMAANGFLPAALAAAMAGCGWMMLKICPREDGDGFAIGNFTGQTALSLACLTAVVCLRSYGGMVMTFPWKKGALAAVSVGALALGKCAGGIASDKLGPVKTTAVSLGLSCVLFMFSGSPAAGIAAIFLFNMTMPVTLWGAAELFENARATAFGLLTLCLYIGMLPGLAGQGAEWIYSLLSAVSLGLLCLGLWGVKKA